MKIKEILKKCTISPPNVFITLWNNKVQINIELCEENDFSNFIATYGNSTVEDWTIESFDGIAYMIFDLKNLVQVV